MASGRKGPQTGTRLVGRTAGLSLPLAALSVASAAGTALSPALLVTHPVLLIALCPRSVFLLAVAGQVEPAVLLPVAGIRLLIADPFHYALGRLHGERAMAWAGRRFRGARLVHDLVPRLLHQAGASAIALAPTGRVLLMAGAVGMPAGRVAVADLVGTTVYVLLLMALGQSGLDALPWLAAGVVAVALAVVAARVLLTSRRPYVAGCVVWP